MDQSCSDLEFFDFNNASEEEIKEIQAILKGPGSNGCVELPWEGPLKETCLEAVSQSEDLVEKTDAVTSKSDTVLDAVVGQALHFTSPQSPASPPVARLPPSVEAFVAPPTTIGPYANTPYFVSRTLPFVRAYHHMGMPFFACPLPGAGETSPMPSPYGQFVPMVPATIGQEKFIGQVEIDPGQKNKGASDRQLNRRSKKKLPNSEYSFESENADVCRDPAVSEEQTSVSSPISTVSSDRPTSVPLVPLPVPQSNFGVAGGTLPLHGYPPGLHTLPYTQMSGPQAPSAAMYYVPVFNHPYGSYIPSPPSAPMVLPVNLRPETESVEVTEVCNEEVLKNVNSVTLPTPVTKSVENTPNVQSNCEVVTPAPEQCIQHSDAKQDFLNPTAKNTLSEVDNVTDCNLSSDNPSNKSVNSSPDCISEKVTVTEDNCKCQSGDEDSKDAGRDASRCWADLFKKPCSEVNGIDRQLATEQGYENLSNLNKEVTNGKLYSVPASNNVL